MFKDTVSAGTAAAGLTMHIWLSWVPVVWQGAIAFLGGIVLVLTVYHKLLEIKQKKRDLAQ